MNLLVAVALFILSLAAVADRAPGTGNRDRYLDPAWTVLTPDRFPTASEVAEGCDSAQFSAIAELEAAGAHVDRTLDGYTIRNLTCAWADRDRRIAECRFQAATVPFGVEEEEGLEAYRARLAEEDWNAARARFAQVQRQGLSGSPATRWIATDTCEPFVFRVGDTEIDLRDAVRSGRRRQ